MSFEEAKNNNLVYFVEFLSQNLKFFLVFSLDEEWHLNSSCIMTLFSLSALLPNFSHFHCTKEGKSQRFYKSSSEFLKSPLLHALNL